MNYGKCETCGSNWPSSRPVCPRCPVKDRNRVLEGNRERQEAERIKKVRGDSERRKKRAKTAIERAIRIASERDVLPNLDSDVTETIPETWRHIESLGYIVHIDNIASILQHGILSFEAAREYPHESIADTDVQSRRIHQIPGTAFTIHDCAVAYINPRNAMMSAVLRKTPLAKLAVIQLSAPSILHLPNAVISDRNAAADSVQFYPSPAGLSELDRSQVFAERWHVNDITNQPLKQRMMAEVLAPGAMPATSIIGIATPTSAVAAALRARYRNQRIVADGRLFFQ